MFGWLRELSRKIWSGVINLWTKLRKIFSTIFGWLIKIPVGIFNWIDKVVKNIFSWIGDRVEKTFEWIEDRIKKTFVWLKKQWMISVYSAVLIGMVLCLIFKIISFWTFIIIIGLVSIILIAFVVRGPLYWYIAYFLAKYDIIFTNVPESYLKIVVRFGAVKKVLMSKKGYKVNNKGDIVLGEDRDVSLPGGLRIVGWPGIDRIYTRQMKFFKSLSDGNVKEYNVENVDTFYARVDYPYALPFASCEDKNNLPLHGHATLLAHIVNPEKSLFATANFYETMIGLVLPSVRERLKRFSFDRMLKDRDNLDKIIWEQLKFAKPGESEGVIGELREKYGIAIVAFRIVNIDPPEAYRDVTLKKWTAAREADAAREIAKKEAEETEGRVIESVARANGMSRKELEEELKKHPEKRGMLAKDGGYKEDFDHARDVLKRDRAGAGLDDIRVGNVDGTPLEPGLASIAAMFGLVKREGGRRGDKGGSSGKEAKSPESPEELTKLAEDFFKENGIYPSWDPKGRGLKKP